MDSPRIRPMTKTKSTRPLYLFPLRDHLLRSLASPLLAILAISYVRLSWIRDNVLADLVQAQTTLQQTCATMAAAIDAIPALPEAAAAMALSAADTVIHASLDALAKSLGFAIHLTQAALLQFASSQTRIWRCLVSMVLSTAENLLIGAATDAQSLWNSGVVQITSSLNSVIDTLNSQLLGALGSADFQSIFGSSVSTRVAIPRITDSFANQFSVSPAVVQSLTSALGGIPSMDALLDQLDAIMAAPFESLASSVESSIRAVANSTSLTSANPWSDDGSMISGWQRMVRTTPEWDALDQCQQGAGPTRALMDSIHADVAAALEWWLAALQWALLGAWAVSLIMSLSRALYARSRARRLRRQSAEDMVWSLVNPLHCAVVSNSLFKGRSTIGQQYFSRAMGFVLYRPTLLAILGAGSVLALAQVQLSVLALLTDSSNRAVVVDRGARVLDQLASVILSAANASTLAIRTDLASQTLLVEARIAAVAHQVSADVGAPLQSALSAINGTLSSAADELSAAAAQLLQPVPALNAGVQQLLTCLIGRQLGLVRDLAAAAARATTVPSVGTAGWAAGAAMVSSAARELMVLAARHVKVARATDPVAKVLSTYQSALAREQTMATWVLAVALVPAVLGIGCVVVEAVVEAVVSWYLEYHQQSNTNRRPLATSSSSPSSPRVRFRTVMACLRVERQCTRILNTVGLVATGTYHQLPHSPVLRHLAQVAFCLTIAAPLTILVSPVYAAAVVAGRIIAASNPVSSVPVPVPGASMLDASSSMLDASLSLSGSHPSSAAVGRDQVRTLALDLNRSIKS